MKFRAYALMFWNWCGRPVRRRTAPSYSGHTNRIAHSAVYWAMYGLAHGGGPRGHHGDAVGVAVYRQGFTFSLANAERELRMHEDTPGEPGILQAYFSEVLS
jgi:hypothetical protein